MLYVEDGELGGAATGKIEIFNGPIPDEYANIEFKAFIHEGYAYLTADVAGENYSAKISTDAIIESISSPSPVSELIFSLISFS